MNHCRDCKHLRRETTSDDIAWLHCSAMYGLEDISGTYPQVGEGRAQAMAHYSDSDALLLVTEMFGCVLWEKGQ